MFASADRDVFALSQPWFARADGGDRRCGERRPVVVGVGAGWDEREYAEFGYADALPPIRERLAHLERTLQVLRERQRSPILVGGGGEKVLLRLVAQYADACNFTDSFDPAFYRHKLDVLRRHCDEVGRDYDAIEKTASFTVNAGDEVDFASARRGGNRDVHRLPRPADRSRAAGALRPNGPVRDVTFTSHRLPP